ncbi:MAG: Gfo/Idh/MocA family oxidoreductase [Verrucomicrobiae bacterium]|nr:Gfo/Idh/MocA family oxidoreductase [Verrucomicrobiae bacterium]
MNAHSRRSFIRTALGGAAGLIVLPNIMPRGLFAAPGPNSRIQVAQIGCGRMGREDMEGVMAHKLARVVAVCDVDKKRAALAKQRVIEFYKAAGEADVAVQVYHDYRELLSRPDIDAIVVSTPDHWHALIAIEGALAGKHLFVQKPITYDVAEAIALRKVVRAKKVVLQTGSQQRSEKPWSSFRTASELVRNGRIGTLKTIRIGIGLDRPKGKPPAPQPVPANLDFERWLGPAPEQPYMEDRVHPQDNFGRPGWITTEDFGLGMITNWGTHHVDIAQWAMGQENGGPKTIEATAMFMTNDVWTVHTTYHVDMRYPNGVLVVLDDKFENGVHFEGTEGWIFCTRGSARVTSSDPNAPEQADRKGALRASDPKLLEPLGPNAIRWPPSQDHYLNWLEAVAAGRDPVAPVEHAVRTLEACFAAWVAMKLNRKLTWDVTKEKFVDDPQANALLRRKPRKPEYDFNRILSKTPERA